MTEHRFLLDRSLGGRIVVTSLLEAGWDATTLAQRFGDVEAQQMSDEAWIGTGAMEGYVLLTKDSRVATRPLEAQAIYMHDARVFALPRADMTGQAMAQQFVQATDAIMRCCSREPGPYVMVVSDGRLRRKHLGYPAI